jgi:Ca2+-binding EF-hand superfamily protein
MVDKRSPDEILDEVVIEPVESERLAEVFTYFVEKSEDLRERESCTRFGAAEVAKVLRELNCLASKAEVQLMVWEVDEDLDGYVSRQEFEIMYKRSVSDLTGLEPRKLFNLVRFLMYDQGFKGSITVEETLKLLLVRFGKDRLDSEIFALFGANEMNEDGTEKSIAYNEYLAQVKRRALEERRPPKKKK